MLFYSHSLKMRCVLMGDIKRSQLCVPCGTKPIKFSAKTIPPSQDAQVLLNVVINIEPPG